MHIFIHTICQWSCIIYCYSYHYYHVCFDLFCLFDFSINYVDFSKRYFGWVMWLKVPFFPELCCWCFTGHHILFWKPVYFIRVCVFLSWPLFVVAFLKGNPKERRNPFQGGPLQTQTPHRLVCWEPPSFPGLLMLWPGLLSLLRSWEYGCTWRSMNQGG